jgi:hypothetical protein
LELFFLQHAGTTMKRLTVALIAALSSPLVLAVEKPYIGIDYQLGTYTESNFEVKPEAKNSISLSKTPQMYYWYKD